MMRTKRKMDQGVFSYLNQRGVARFRMDGILTSYAKNILGMRKPRSKVNKWFDKVEVLIQDNFVEFQGYVKDNIKNTNGDGYNNYNDWFDSCNTNGQFAYNDITDDF